MAAENVKISAERFRTMKLDKRCELIGGEIVLMSPAPGFLHQKISGDLFFCIKSYILKHKGSCQVYAAPADVKLNDDNVVEPDIFVTCDPSRIDGQYHNGAPDWVIEILSPSTAGTDLGKKLYLYKSSGVREYWAVDPDEKRIIVYLFEGERSSIEFYSFEDSISAGIYRNNHEPLIIRAADFFNE